MTDRLVAAQNAPSGIAQLRKSSMQAVKAAIQDDHMDLDDFLVPTSIATPGSESPPASIAEAEPLPFTIASAIPIKLQQRLHTDDLSLARASAPSVAPLETSRTNPEFAYVQRHVRKTSIDERRVCRSTRRVSRRALY